MFNRKYVCYWGLCLLLASFSAGRAQNAAITINVNAGANRHAISPMIYGTAFASPTDLSTLNIPLNRSGGNATSRYNWQINASNHGSDWYFESIGSSSAVAGADGDSFISANKSAGAQSMLTIPMIGWVAKLGANRAYTAGFSQAKYGAQTGNDWQWFPDAGNGVLKSTGQNITGNDPNDADVPSDSTFQSGWMAHLIQTWGTASSGGLKYYLMDNEPSLWHSTHRDVHPIGATMSEVESKIVDYASKVKANDPNALVVGPEEWGWSGYFYSGYDQQYGNLHGWSTLPDRNANGGWDYLPWVLNALHQHDVSSGTKSLDVFSVHYYPQSGEFSNDVSTTMELTRNRSTRSLWDPTYVDSSWIGSIVQLIPRLKNWVATYYPGLQTAITEYNWGAEGYMNGATTQADIWGIFGREGLDLATRWTTPASGTPTYQAMKMFRNYDGNKSTFGDVSVATAVPNPDNVSSFSAQRSSDGALTVMVISKVLSGTTPVTLSLANFTGIGAVETWQLTGSSPAIQHLPDSTFTGTSLTFTAPAQSITLLVFPTSQSIPAAPGALSAIGGNSEVSLSWPACAGAVSYKVKRSSTTGGPYTVIATPTSPNYVDTAVTNGTTYYYVVSAVNLNGESPNSAEAAGTPTAGVPAAPTGLTATAGNTQVVLNWTAVTGAASYNVKRSMFSGGPYTTLASPTTTGYTDTGLANNATYYYVVSAVNGNGEGQNSAQVSATPVPPPSFTSSATASPSTLASGAVSTITATVNDTGGPLTNGIVDLEVYSPSGAKVAQQYWSAQNFSAGQTHTYSYNWTAGSTGGTYSVAIGVFDSTWATNYHWNGSAGSVVVQAPPAPTFSSSAVASPSTVASGAVTAITATVKDTANTLTNGIVDLEVYSPSGAKVAQQTWSAQNFSAGQTQTYTYNWTAPATTGAYTIAIGVFDSTWATDYHWNGSAGALTVISVPAAPTGLTASAGIAAVALSWTASTGATSYNVKRSTTSGGPYTTVGTSTTASYSDSGLTNGTTYYYVVSAVNSAGESANSSQASGTPQSPGPPAPTNVLTIAGNKQVSISWSVVSGANYYNVKRSTTSGTGYVTVTPASNPGITDSNLTNGTTYYYVVTAVSAAGESPYSSEASATPFSVAPPAAPTNAKATGGNNVVSIGWNVVSGATYYNIKRSTTSGSGYVTITAASNPGIADSTAKNGTTYYYVVSAVNSGGESPNSSEVSALPGAGTAPTNVKTYAGNKQVSIGWDVVSGALYYNVKRSTTSGTGYVTVTPASNPGITDSNLTNGTTYYYVVTAVSAAGESPYSSEASATPFSVAPPASAPTNVKATAGNNVVSIGWNIVSGASYYNIKRSTTSGSGYVTITAASNPGIADSTAVNGTTYYYVVSAFNSGGEGPNSSEVSATPHS